MRFLVLMMAAIAAPSIAQPVVPPGNGNHLPYETYALDIGELLPFPPLGVAGAVWDFSGFVPTGQYQEEWSTPPATGAFPEATVAGAGPLANSVIWYRGDNDAFYELGMTSPSVQYTCDVPRVVMPYPITFGDVITDAYSCTGIAPGAGLSRTGSTVFTGASYGTLLLPGGSYDNVLMVAVEHTQVTTIGAFDYLLTVSERRFFQPGVKRPLFRLHDEETNPGGIVQYSEMTTSTNTGLMARVEEQVGLSLWPNPASGEVLVMCQYGAGPLAVELHDAMGRTVRQLTLPHGEGLCSLRMDLQGIVPGQYVMHTIDRTGRRYHAHLLVQ